MDDMDELIEVGDDPFHDKLFDENDADKEVN